LSLHSRESTRYSGLHLPSRWRITEPELGQRLGLGRLQIDGFLKAHGVYQDITIEDVDPDVTDLKAWASDLVHLVIADTTY
jgi:hypothetical protein